MQDSSSAAATKRHSRAGRLKWLAILLLAAVLAVLAWLVEGELRTSRLQARYFSAIGREASFHTAAGPSDSIRFPSRSGPYDLRMGYQQLPQFTARLAARGFAVTAQARQSPKMIEIADRGLSIPYAEKDQAGLQLFDERGAPLYLARYPQHVYPRFEAIPPLLVNTLTFIEDRLLLDPSEPRRNPALDWGRFTLAAREQALKVLNSQRRTLGGSTLATQIDKFRHSPGGRTGTPSEKLRQMISASLAAYRDGESTLPARRAILVRYLNTEPLAAQPGRGEIQGFGDGLAAWYGRDFDEVNRLLRAAGASTDEIGLRDAPAAIAEQALAYKQALSLLIAQRAPSFYLVQNNTALSQLTDSYLRVLASNGIISAGLRDAALRQPLAVRHVAAAAAPVSFVGSKAVSLTRVELLEALGLQNAYDLDRLDLSARSTIVDSVQQAVSARLARVRSVAGAQEAGLYGFNMLRPGDDPSKIAFSFTLFERTPGANVLRVQTDSVDQPFDVNQGARLNLGSTAKLRTIVLYLQIIAELHARYAHLEALELARVQPDRLDALTRWATQYLRNTPDRSLPAMLAASLGRTYSGNPGEVFITGGGAQTFTNFEASENARTVTVREAFQHSVNLVFVRLMRDIVRYEMVQQTGPSARWLEDPGLRQKYLTRFADEESQVFLDRFKKKYARLSPDQARAKLIAGIHKSPVRLAAALRSIAPDASPDWFGQALRAALKGTRGEGVSAEEIDRLYARYGPAQFDLADRAYLAGVNPLELWLVAYLRTHPNPSRAELLQASHDARLASYGWLFKSGSRAKQDRRILAIIERDAYRPILRAWRALGYPFQSITPSYGSAVGAAGDRPAALAQLMGVIANDGKMAPSEDLTELTFAAGTPYETRFTHRTDAGQPVLSPAIADEVKLLLRDVVQGGTGRRLAGGLPVGQGRTLPVQGKTGTGDQRFNVYARGGGLIESRKVNRTATFVFMIGDRFYGTVTAYTHEPYAARYTYTSAMAVQLLQALGPALAPVLDGEEREVSSRAPRRTQVPTATQVKR